MKFILASGSPRRKDLLTRENIEYVVDVSNEEEIVRETDPKLVVLDLSRQKAEAVIKKHPEDCILLSADTVVSISGEILGKPKTEEEAFSMIEKIEGKSHEVYTGVCLMKKVSGEVQVKQFYECSEVFVKHLTKEEISLYIETRESMDKAGAYAIQGIFGKHIDHIEGDYDNIVGLPVKRVLKEFETL